MVPVPAITEAGRERLRPILMTTLTLIFGLMPIALSGSSGSEWKSGLAVALVGGLSSSMFLTLLVIPVVYVWFDRVRVWVVFVEGQVLSGVRWFADDCWGLLSRPEIGRFVWAWFCACPIKIISFDIQKQFLKLKKIHLYEVRWL